MRETCKTNSIDLKGQILAELKLKDPETHSKLIGFLGLIRLNEIANGRFSVIFLLDLFFAFENGSINIAAVMHEIKFLEGEEEKSNTKEASQFKRLPLKGLWHKHYFGGSIPALAQNVQNALGTYGIPYFQKRIGEAKESGQEQFVTAEDVPHIVSDIMTGNLGRRREDQKITGEWLVYAIYEGVNYYLCLAKHDDGDDRISEKINSVGIVEFPFLKSIFLN